MRIAGGLTPEPRGLGEPVAAAKLSEPQREANREGPLFCPVPITTYFVTDIRSVVYVMTYEQSSSLR